MRRFFTKKVVGIGLATGLVLGGAGAAFAYFTSTGSGTATGYVGAATPWTVTASWPSGHYMYPDTSWGDANQVAIPVSITNNTPGNMQLQNLKVTLSTPPAGCAASWFQAGYHSTGYALGTALTGYAQLVAGNATVNTTVYLELIDSHSNQTHCAGWTPTVRVTAN